VTRTEEDDYQNFVNAIQQADEVGYTPYWLGRNITYEGVTFLGPSMPDFGGEIEGGIGFTYDAPLESGGGSIDIVLVGDASWDKSPFSQPVRDSGVTAKKVIVAGAAGTLMFIPGGTRPINATRLYLDIGDTHLVATAHAGSDPSPGITDSNPLIYEAAFLSVMQNLRPYPD
jgi:hypothetical protein